MKYIPLSPAPGPVVITSIPSLTSITITWEEPERPNGVITQYEVSFWPTESPESITNRTGLETNFTTPDGQEPGTSFTFTVTAFTSVGAGNTTTLIVPTLTQRKKIDESQGGSNVGGVVAGVIITLVIVGSVVVIIAVVIWL